MRASNRDAILDAAVAVVEGQGITAVTFDAVAAASGVTRGGILYHFKDRDQLIAAMHRHMAAQWERHLEEACGKPAAEASLTERVIAYIRVCATSATRAELQMLLESPHGEHHQPWIEVVGRWTPSRDEDAADAHRIALLTADGLWVHEAIGQTAVSRGEREVLADRIIATLEAAVAAG